VGKVVDKLSSILNYFNELMKFLDTYDPNRTFKFRNVEVREKFHTLFESFRDAIVDVVCGDDIKLAEEWRNILLNLASKFKKTFGLLDIVFSKELSSFLKDPKHHLKKKIFLYVHDLLRGKVSFEEFAEKAYPAIMTSLRTNMRTIYQDWVFLAILLKLHERGFRLVYPELGVLSLERHSKQKLGYIPPNAVLRCGFTSISFFIEAPRPISWEDTQDLSRIWSLYTALRPDMLVYGDAIFNIVDLERSPPIVRPHVIIECKELPDWYTRVRYIRGPLAKPLSAEEWRSKWLVGLRQGLADILGIEVKKVDTMIEEKKSIKLKDEQIVMLYRSVYKPDIMFVVSRCRVPENIKDRLRDQNIEVIDDVGFNIDKIEPLIDKLVEICKKYSTYRMFEENDTISIIEAMVSKIFMRNISRDVIRKAIVEYISRNIDDFVKFLKTLTS